MNNTLRVVDVMIAGAQKSGTTSLANYLVQHPQIMAHQQMEMTYFVNSEEYQLGYEKAFNYYFSSDCIDSKVLMGKSVGIMYFKHAMERLYQHNPNCKIIVILRNPIARAYSAYWYMRRVGYETADTFAKALELESSRKEKQDVQSMHCLYRDRGIYHEQIKNLYEVFGTENVYTLLLDDLKSEVNSVFPSLLSFLGVDDSLKIEVTRKSNQAKLVKSETLSGLLKSDLSVKKILKKIIPASYLRATRKYIQKLNETPFEVPEMEESVKSDLIEFFRPHNQKLEVILNRKIDHWNQ